jgi:hypothetical protein
MTGVGTGIGSVLAAAAVAVGGVLAGGGIAGSGASGGEASGSGVTGSGTAGSEVAGIRTADGGRTALVVDADLARDGRELIDPRLRALDAELRLPRTSAEAETDLRYFAAQGYRLVVAGPDSRAAAQAAGVHAGSLAGLAGSR